MNQQPGDSPITAAPLLAGATSRLALWQEMRERWQRGERLRVEDYLAGAPERRDDSDFVLDLIYAEFVIRRESGEAPCVEDYVGRFPHLLGPITRQLLLHDELDSLLEAPPSTHPDPPREAPPGPALPETIGKYRVLCLLGQGGQSLVYRAFDPALQREVVIKVGRRPLGAPENEALQMEGRILAELDQPGLVRVFDCGTEGGLPYLVLEHVRGQGLDQAARGKGWPACRAAGAVACVARAAGAAHRRGVFHRDVKPGNILIDEMGQARLIDFGLAHFRLAGTPQGEAEVCGTPAFMAPEQARGEGPPGSAASDVFSLGAVLYWLLTGKAPFAAADVLASLRLAARGDWDRRPLDDARVPGRLRAVCVRALALAPAERYPSADDFAAAVERAVRPPRWLPVLVGLGGVLLLALAGWSAWARFQAPSLPVPAEPVRSIIQVEVWNDRAERYRNLLYCLPLRTGDELRIRTARPAGHHVALLWRDSTGHWCAPRTITADSTETELTYPGDPGKSVALRGASGTELLLVCGRRSRPIQAERLANLLNGEKVWPALPPLSLLRLDSEHAWAEHTGRAPGKVRDRPDPEGEVVRRLDALRLQLRDEFDFLSGLAFRHE